MLSRFGNTVSTVLLYRRCSRYRYRFFVSPFYSYQHQRDAYAKSTHTASVHVSEYASVLSRSHSNLKHSSWLFFARHRLGSFGFRSCFNYIREHFINTYIVQCPHMYHVRDQYFIFNSTQWRTHIAHQSVIQSVKQPCECNNVCMYCGTVSTSQCSVLAPLGNIAYINCVVWRARPLTMCSIHTQLFLYSYAVNDICGRVRPYAASRMCVYNIWSACTYFQLSHLVSFAQFHSHQSEWSQRLF